ncbi:MAG: ATP-binding protein [Flavobacteriales bacterium]|nr:ATP-binding protein [Flavobacteriales bacterium]
MNTLREKHNLYINKIQTDFVRDYINHFPWDEQLIGIRGSRGVGKTTLLFQYIKSTYGLSEKALYISLDDLYFIENTLSDFAASFVQKGGEHLFIDEVHKYENWAIEIKNIYDQYDELKVVFTGSSLLEILNSKADLSRRALVFEMQGLSFREFLALKYDKLFKSYDLEQLLEESQSISALINSEIKPLQYFTEYLKSGYYPFFKKENEFYYQRLREVVSLIIEIELPTQRKIAVSKIKKVKQLLFIIAQSVPFKPNIKKLSERIGITRNTLVEYLNSLTDANLIQDLNKDTFGISLLQKPDKIYLENTNLSYALSLDVPNKGNIRETFFYNQLKKNNSLTYPEKGDFLVNNKYLFEVGGRSKTAKQISGVKNSYLALDDIEFSDGKKIPLWLFGFLY